MVNGEISEKLTPGNNAACKRYYERNTLASRRRVLLHAVTRFGRVSKKTTLDECNVDIFEIIQAFRKYKQSCSGDISEKKLTKFQMLIGEML